MKRAIALLLLFLCAGCVTTGTSQVTLSASVSWNYAASRSDMGEHAAIFTVIPSPECDRLDSARRTWGAIAVGSAISAGASGGVAALYDASTPRVVVGLTTLGTAIFSAVAAFMTSDYASSYRNLGCYVTPVP